MMDFLVNLAPNLSPKTHQKSTQEAPKIDKKGYSKHDASWLEIWRAPGTDFWWMTESSLQLIGVATSDV